MKFSQIGIIIIFIVIAALTVSGCTRNIISPGPSTAATSTTKTTVSTAPTSSTTAGSIPTVNFNQLHMFEYTFNANTGDTIAGDLKTAHSIAPFGDVQNARRTQTNKTANTAAGLSITTVDVYTSQDGSVLGGFFRAEVGGQLTANRSIEPGEQVDKSQTSTPVLTAADAAGFTKSLKNAGQDQIVVPAGSFTCTKYVLQGEDNSMSYWFTPNVPLPVKMTTTDAITGKVTMTMELVGYS